MSFIELSKIAGLSKFNARQQPDAGEQFDELCDSIREKGLTHPIVLRLEDDEHRVLDGGRRFQALRKLCEAGEFGEFNVPVSYFEGSDEDAYELSLISFVQRRDLHPVDEFERFVELRDRFHLDESAIARRTGKSLRFVKQRLRLARLAPAVRQAWREGRLMAEQAQAFSATNNQDAQEAFLADPRMRNWRAKDISRHFRDDDAVSAKDARAIFVGLDAYVAAGGRVDEQLFEDESYLLDEAILDMLAREKLEAEGERIAREEGWGWYETTYSVSPGDVFDFSIEPDYSWEERERLDEIEGCDGDDEEDERNAREAKEIEARAMLRAVSFADRATLGLYLAIDYDGTLDVTRAVRERAAQMPAAPAERASGEGVARPASAKSAASTDEGEKVEAFGKSTRAILDETATGALAEVTARNPRLALVFAVAAIGCGYGADSICLKDEGWRAQDDVKSDLLREIEEEPFEKALAICARAEMEDCALVPVAFAELIGRNIHAAQAKSFDQPRILLAIASRFSDICGALKREFDYEGYFKAEARGAAIEAIRVIDGEAAANEAAKLKKPELAKRAALLAKDRAWLPEALASAIELPASRDERSTAEAMRDAIEADEASGASAANGEGNDTNDKMTRVETFIELRCYKGNDALDAGRVKASELYQAFKEFCAERELNPLGLQEFGATIAELGIEKKRLKTGVHYLNLALRGAAQDQAA